MIKAFISHSSEQKQFVLDLVEILGRDYCIVDCYNFNSAYQTINEIYDKIDKSTVFVLLLSKASLSPEWMKKDKCFNLKKFKSCKILAHDIEQKFRRIIWSKNPKRKQLETLMVGRNKDIDNFENIYQSARGMNLRALVISG